MDRGMRFTVMAGIAVLSTLTLTVAQQMQSNQSQPMPARDHSKMHKGEEAIPMHSSSQDKPDSGELEHTMKSMPARHMDMGPHMKMTELQPPNTADQERADHIVDLMRVTLEKYKDYRAALNDGYKIFAPEIPTPIEHFTNWRFAMQAQFRFDPQQPTSLLYERHGHGYKLIGAMLTAPKRFTEDDLDKRVPLSVAQWHEHINMCSPPRDQKREMYSRHPKFGLAGSISTQEQCETAGGTFHPVIFNWMVHIYPFEQKPEAIWSVERQHAGHMHTD